MNFESAGGTKSSSEKAEGRVAEQSEATEARWGRPVFSTSVVLATLTFQLLIHFLLEVGSRK